MFVRETRKHHRDFRNVNLFVVVALKQDIIQASASNLTLLYVLTLFNSSEKIEDAVVCVNGNGGEINVSLGKFEIKRIEVNV